MKPIRKKEGRTEEELKIDAQKGYDSRVLVEIWYRRFWTYERERETGALNILR